MLPNQGYIHSVKVPRLYKNASKIIQKVLEEGGSIKDLLYSTVKVNLKGVYALITKTIQENAVLDLVIKKCNVLKENPMLNAYLAKILVAELLLGKGCLQGNCKPIQTVCKYRTALESAYQELKVAECHQGESNPHIGDIYKPRYVRVNTLRLTCDEVIKQFRYEGWQLVPFNGAYSDYLDVARSLTEEQFIRDIHIKDLLVFPPGTEFFNHPLYLDGTLILQDKASCLPPLVLSPNANNVVLDMCAAPGMKTTLLSSIMRGKGRVVAVERNPRRYDSMCSLITTVACQNVTTVLGDSLSVSGEWTENVDMILVDPSCSGTGMTERAKLFTHKQTDERLRKLSGFQFKLLYHALTAFPKAQRVVYSTCSVLVEENEAVVSSVLSRLTKEQWQISHAMPEWPSRGSKDFSFGTYCLTSRPQEDMTTGFFIALFEKVNKDDSAEPLGCLRSGKKKSKKRLHDIAEGCIQEMPPADECVKKCLNDKSSHQINSQKKTKGEMTTIDNESYQFQSSSEKIIQPQEADSVKKAKRRKKSTDM